MLLPRGRPSAVTRAGSVLGLRALRIENAFRHDMPGLAVSLISPLPHQLDAVYGIFLEEPVLRFLLADDPGARARRSWRGCTSRS